MRLDLCFEFGDEDRKGRERSERNSPVDCFGARVRAVGAGAP